MSKLLKLQVLRNELRQLADPAKAKILSGFFKTAKGQYGEGDVFLGVTVPKQRLLAKKFAGLQLPDIARLLGSKIHEERLVALLILVRQYEQADERVQKVIAGFYLKHTERINNWDLVDLSAPRILGRFLLDKPKAVLYRLAKSKNIWERRIAVLATFQFIAHARFGDSLKLAELLLEDNHDLIHKAVGWMLRELGKRSKALEVEFLNKHCKTMPRTMLRYAIEKFPEHERKKYLLGQV